MVKVGVVRKIKKLPIFVLFGLVLFFIVAGVFSIKALAATAPGIITYQGKLLIGGKLATTTQDMYFVLYDAPAGGNILYTANGTVAVPQAISTTPSAGLFSVNLGDTGTNTLLPTIFQNNGSVYLEVRINGDTLTPRKRITASPYAFNSKYLDGVGINTLSSTTYIPISDATGNFLFNSTTISTSTISNLVAGFTTTTYFYANSSIVVNSLITSASTTNLYVSGALNLPANSVTDAMIPDTITASNYLLLTGGVLSGALTFISASGTMITSTNALFVNATTTNFSASGITSLAGTTITNLTSTNHFSGGLTFTNLSGSNATTTNLVVTSLTNLASTTITNGTSTNFNVGSVLLFATANGTSLTISNATTTNLYVSGLANFTNSTTMNTSTITGGLYQTGLGDCKLESQTLNYDINTGKFVCLTDAGAGAGVGASNVNYFAIYDTSNSVTGTSLMQLVNGAITFTTNTSFLFVSSTSALFYNASTTNFAVTGNANFQTTTIGGQLTFSTASGTSITSTNIIVTNKIGIGTSTPTQALSVVGNISNIIDYNTPISEIATTAVDSGPYSIFVSGRYAYTANRNADNISIIDISNPYSPVQISTTSVGSGPYSIFVSGRYAYVANRGSATMSVLDISNPFAPIQISTVLVGNGPQSVFVSGRYAYVANSLDDSISVVDVSNSFAPVQIATTSVELTPKSIFISGRYAYTANSGGSMSVVDISNPATPVQIATTSVGDSSQSLGPSSIFVSGRYAYTVNANDTFSVIDIANPLIPLEVATTTVGAGTQWLYVSGRYAYITNNGDSNVSVVDISKPLTPKQIAVSGLIAGSPLSVYVSGRYAYTTNLDDTISVIDISGTEVTSLIAHSAEVGNLQSRNDIFAQGNIMAGTSLMVGAGGIYSQGGLSVFSSSTGVTSSIFNVGSVISSSTLRVFADGSIMLGTTTMSGLFTFTNATGTNITSTNGFFTTLSSTRLFAGAATSSNGFFTTLSSTNFFASAATSSYLYISGNTTLVGGLIFNTASGTAITSTNAFFDFSSSTRLFAGAVTSSNGFFTTLSSTNFFTSAVTSSYLSILGNANFAGALTFNTASGTSLTSTNAFFTNLSGTNFNPTNIFATSITSTNLFATSSVFNTTTINNRLGVGTSTPSKALSVVGSISNVLDPNSDISLVTSTTLTSASPWAIFVSGKYAYVVHNGGSGILSVLDISNPSLPVQVATTSLGNTPKSIYVSGKYAYVGNDNDNTISVVDISSPASPRQISTTTIAGENSLFVSGRYIYGHNGSGNSVAVTDISIPTSPRLISNVIIANLPSSIYVLGRYAYVTYSTGRLLAVIDVSNPATIVQAGSVSLNAPAESVYVSGRYAYVANNTSNTISVVDVSNPASPSQIATTTVPGNPISIFVSGRYAFTANSASNTVSVIDISVPTSPNLIKTISVGASPKSVYVSGRYAYVTNNSSSSVSIIDISGTEVTSLVAHSAEFGNLQLKNDIFAQGNVMVGTSLMVGSGGISSQGGLSVFSSSTGATTAIFNVGSVISTNTLRIFADGTIALGTTTMVGLFSFTNSTGTALTSTYAFHDFLSSTRLFAGAVTSSNGFFTTLSSTNFFASAATTSYLNVLGNTNLTSGLTFNTAAGSALTSTNGFFSTLSSTNFFTSAATSSYLSILGNANFAGALTFNTASGTMITSTNLYVSSKIGVNTSSPIASLAVKGIVGTNPFSVNSSTGSSLLTILQNGNVGIGTSTPTQKLSVVGNISNIIDSNTAISQVGSVAIGQPQEIFVSGRYAYVAGFTGNKLSIVDVSVPSSPVVVGSVAVSFGPVKVFVSGRYAYVVDSASGVLAVIDVSNPGAPVQVSTKNLSAYTSNIYVSGRYLYASQGGDSGQIEVVDISNPTAPVLIATTSVGAYPYDVYATGRYAYVANFTSNTMSIVDISNPSAPRQVATTSVGNSPSSVFVSGRYAYVGNQTGSSVSIVDISNAFAPTVVGTATVGSSPKAVFVSGRYLFTVNNSDNNFSIVDISIPSSPALLSTVATGNSPGAIFVSGRYAYVVNAVDETITVFDISGTEVASLIAHSAEVGNLQSRNDIFAQGNIMAGTSLMVGAGGIMSQGGLSVFASSTGSTSSIFSISSVQVPNVLKAFADGSVSIGTSTASSTLTIQGIASSNPALSVVSSSGASMLTVLANGYIGINTTTPQSQLSVVGTAGNNSAFDVASSSGASFLRILANGNIGINSSSPVSTLGIVGSVGVDPLSIVSSTGASMLTILTNGNIGINSSTAASRLTVVGFDGLNLVDFVSSSGVSAFKILANGYVGINSSSPVSIFTVVGTSTFSGNVLPNSSPTPGGSSQVTTTVDSIGGTGQYTSIAIGSDGLPVISYYNVSSTALMVAKCGNASCSSGNVTTTIDDGNDRGRYTSIAIGSDGLPVISYYNVTNADLMVAKCGNASCSSGNVTTTVDSIGNTGQYTSIAIGTDGLPVISYYNVSSTDLMVAKCGNASCSSGNVTTTVDNGGTTGEYTSIAIGTDGLPVISYYSATNQDLIVAKCGNISCSSGNATTTVDTHGVNQYTSIAIGTDGLPVISYYDASTGNLTVAKCGNTSCASDNVARNVTTTLGTLAVGGGQDTSIAIGTDGLPVISAYDSFNGDLLVYKCGNTSCTSTSTATKLDAGGDRGPYTSIAIGTDGLPVISYFNNNSGDLMVAKCADPACKNTTGGSYSGGYNIGSLGSFFNNVYANSFWGKQFQIEGFDLAESYRVDDRSISAGDLVRITTSSSGVRPTVEKTNNAYDGVIGVISTNPGVRLSDWTSSDDGRLVALVGRVPTKVSAENGSILAGDLIAASSLPGVGMKATKEGAIVGRALESFVGAGVATIEVYINPSWAPGQSPLAVNAISSTITIGTSSNPYDLVVTGNIILNQKNLINKLSFATSTLFESSVEGLTGARAFTFNASGFTNSASDNYILSLRANNNSVFSVAANGDVHALGNYYGASAVLGTSTNPGDLAERVDIAIDDNAEAGDVMMVDRNAPDTYRRSDSAYEQSVAGVISTNPTIVVGNGRTDYTAVLAMVGRVPIKVSDENGAISRGDLLVSASRLGYAMKYDPTKDKNNKVVGIIGIALEPLPASTSGKILALIRTGWVYNRDEDIKKLKNNIEQVAMTQGINLDPENNPGNLNIENNNNQLVYSGGNLNLQNNSLINVAGIIGHNNKWRIDESGNLIQKIVTASGDKEIYGLQSSAQQEIVISGTSTLENGSKRVMLTDLDKAVIDRSVPLKVMVTMSGETKGVYVTEKNYDSFLVKENDNGQSNAEFDWTVIAKVLAAENLIPELPPVDNSGGQGATSTPLEPTTSSPLVNIDPSLPATDPVVPVPAQPDPAPAVIPDPVVADPPQVVPAEPVP